eukprot:Seg679.4 transcript_id=Seg679.4/GoldUCD/mRNA.D3Y31 product="hypothetical protein" protein_id=Seg679.4/GoldUCD/D3Y31
MDYTTAKATPEPSVKWTINEPEQDISVDSREASPKKRMSQIDKTKLLARPRSGSPALSGKFKLDYSSDINKLKNTKDGEEQAVLEAKKLRNEIEEQMEISFDLIEERQNEVKDFLHRRELEEEEHKKRAADIVKKLQNGMMDIEDGISKRVRGKPQSKQSEDLKDEIKEIENVNMEKDDKSSQTDPITLKSESIQANPEDFKDEARSSKERKSNQQLNIDDIPDVIEAIKDDLVEKMKMKLADEEDRMEKKGKLNTPRGQGQGETTDLRIKAKDRVMDNSEMGQVDPDRINEIDGPKHEDNEMIPRCKIPRCKISTKEDGEKCIFDEGLNKKLDQLAESIISNEKKNGELSQEMKDMINDNKEEIKDGLLMNVSAAEEISDIDKGVKKDLEEVYQKMKNAFDELGNLIVGQDTKKKEIGMKRLARCRELCRELDGVEDEMSKLNDEIEHISQIDDGKGYHSVDLRTDSSDQTNSNGVNKSTDDTENLSQLGESKVDQRADSSDHLNHNEINDAGSLRDADATGSMLPQVARLRVSNNKKIDNKMYANEDIPAVTDENKQLVGLLNKRIEASKRLDSKLNELQTMLGQQQIQEAMEATDLENNKVMELGEEGYDEKDLKERKSELKGVNLDLKKELDAVYNANRSLAEENRKLLKNFEDMAENKEDMQHNYQIYDDLDIPRWENEHRMKDQLENIKNKIGDKLFKMLVEDAVVDKASLRDLETPGVIALENGNLDQIIKDYEEDLEKLSERYINADISNGLQEITKIKNPDTNRVIENLKSEIDNCEKLLDENEGTLEQDETELNTLIKERNEELKEIQKLQGEKQDLQKMLAETNSLIYKQFPATMSDNDIDAVMTRLQEIDNEVDMIRKELQSPKKRDLEGTQDEGTQNDAPMKDIEGLRELLEKLEPYVNKEVRQLLLEDEQQTERWAAPNQKQVNDIIDLKQGIKNNISRNWQAKANLTKDSLKPHEDRSKTGREKNNEGDNAVSLKISGDNAQEETNQERNEKLKELKKALELINKEMEKMEITPDDKERIKKVKAKNGEKETKKDENGEEITRENAKEKIKNACKRLEKEKERLQEIIDNSRDVEKDLNASGKDKYHEFKLAFEKETSNIEEMIEENWYEVKQINEKIKDMLQSIELENGPGSKQEELGERNTKLNKLKHGIKIINNDLEALNEFEKDGVVKELDDSDMEELAYKIEAIQVSLNRMNKTIEEHLKEDGDPKVLETLIRRKAKMGESFDEANNEMEKRKMNLQQDLRDLTSEKIRIEKEINDMLGDGEITNEDEKEVILEMLTTDDFGQEISSDNDNNDLKSLIKQREKIANEYAEFNRLGQLTEQDGEFLASMVTSIERDIKARLDEMSEANKTNTEKADDLGSNKAFIKEILGNQSELESALSYLKKINEQRQRVQREDVEEGSRHDDNYSSSFDDLKMLAQNKIDAINEKLANLDWFSDELTDGQSPDQEPQTISGKKKAKGKDEKLLRGVKKELESLKTVEKDSDMLNLLAAKTLDEMRLQKESNELLNQLFDDRDEAIDGFIGRGTERDSEGKKRQGANAVEQIKELDRRILEHAEENVHHEPDEPLAQSSPAFQSSEREQEDFDKNGEDDELRSLLGDRNLVLRKIFGVRTRETAKGYSEAEKQSIDDVSTLESELEKKLKVLEGKILQYGSPRSPEFEKRTQSPNFYTMMSEIDNEIETLRTEVEEGKLFISGKEDFKGTDSKVQFEDRSGKGENIKGGKDAEMADDKSTDEDILNLKETLEILEEKRTEVLLADENELIKKRDDFHETMNVLDEKLNILKQRQNIENQISEIETNHSPTTNESEKSSQEMIAKLEDEKEELEKDLRNIDSKIAKFAIAIEREIDGGEKMDSKSDDLSPDDQKHVETVLKEKLNELIEERMKLERIKGNMERDRAHQGQLQDLVDKRKDIIEKLNEVSDELNDKKLDEKLAEEFKEKRNKYKGEIENKKLLERKKNELEQYLKEMEPENELSAEDVTSGFSDTSLENKEKEYLNIIEKQGEKIKELNELIKELTLERDHAENALIDEKPKVSELEGKLTELERELEEKDDLINEREQETLMLRNEINDLNEAGEAMLEVANAMDEQNQSKSIEIELNHDRIRELENRLKKMDKESEKDVGESHDIELELENQRLDSENIDLNKELESLKDEMKGLRDKLDKEKVNCQKLENEMKMLDKLKEELKSKGKKTLKVEMENLQSTIDKSGSGSGFDNEAETKGAENDLKHEIDKVTAIDEIMKIAAELLAENERKTSNCKDLETQKDELTRILEELLDKCQSHSEKIENLQKELDGKEELNKRLKDEKKDTEIAELKSLLEGERFKGVAPRISEVGPKIEEENIVAMDDRNLMYEPHVDTRQFEDEIIDLTNIVKELSKENDELRLKEEVLETKLQEAENGLESEKDCLKLAESEIEELMGRIRAMHDNIKKQMITEHEMINFELKKEIKDLKMEKQQSEHENSLAAKRNDILRNQIDGIENEKMQILGNMKEIKKNLEEQNHLMFEERQKFDKDKNEQLTEIARLKNDYDVVKFENEQIKALNERKMKTLIAEIEEEKRGYERLEMNFERMKSAKENMIKDYEKQLNKVFDEEMNQGGEEIEMLRTDLEEKIKERKAMNEKYHKLKEKLDEKDDEMIKKITDLRNELQEMKKELLGKGHEIEDEKMKNKLIGIEMEKYKKQLVEETMDNREREDKMVKERDNLKEKLKNCEQIIGQLKERNSLEKRSRDIQIDDLEEQNENLEEKMKKLQEKLMKELDKKEILESKETENNILKNQLEIYKERMIDITENFIQKGKAEQLKNELIKIKNEYHNLKNESINI